MEVEFDWIVLEHGFREVELGCLEVKLGFREVELGFIEDELCFLEGEFGVINFVYRSKILFYRSCWSANTRLVVEKLVSFVDMDGKSASPCRGKTMSCTFNHC